MKPEIRHRIQNELTRMFEEEVSSIATHLLDDLVLEAQLLSELRGDRVSVLAQPVNLFASVTQDRRGQS